MICATIFKLAVHEHIERVRDDAFGGILDRHDAVICAIFAHFGKNVGNGFLRGITQTGTKPANGGLMGESGFRPEIGNGHRFFQRERAGHDLTINRPQRFVRDGPVIQFANALEDRPLTMRRVNFFAGLELDVADLRAHVRALVQQLDDLGVQLVNGFAMLGNVHDEGSLGSA